VGASVVAGCDATPVFDSSEQVLNLVALLVEGLVVVELDLAVGFGWDAGCDPSAGQRGAEPVAVIAFVSEQGLGLGERGKQQKRAFVVAHLTFCQQQDDRLPKPIADRMELRVQPALGAPDTSGNSPPFSRLAAVRCALR